MINLYYRKQCAIDESGHPLRTYSQKPDSCLWAPQYLSLRVTTPEICDNGTMALLATYSRAGCKPENLLSLSELPETYSDGCADIQGIDSIAFICEGLPAEDIGNKGSIGGLVKILLLVLLVMALMTALSVLSCVLKGAAMVNQMKGLWQRTTGQDEGGIQL